VISATGALRGYTEGFVTSFSRAIVRLYPNLAGYEPDTAIPPVNPAVSDTSATLKPVLIPVPTTHRAVVILSNCHASPS
jgi:hypothetical protein